MAVTVSRTVLLLVIMFLALSSEAGAVPAAPLAHQLRQLDGETFAARQWGDEFRAGWETEDGYTILFDQELAAWTYAEHGSRGELKSSRRRVGRDAPHEPAKGARSLKGHGLSRRVRPFAFSPAASSGAPGNTAGAGSAFDTTPQTSRNIPVILINFSDTVPTYSAADFSTMLFGSGNWSFKDYYEEISGGTFTVTPGPSGVQGWYTATGNHDYYGQASGWGPPDKWPGDLAFEAVSQADAAIDFSAYDVDGDCIVDVVAIVHQGPGQEASAATADIWSHSWSLSSTYGFGLGHYGAYTTNDICPSDPGRFMVVDDYIMMPETLPAGVDPGITTIGVFAHEYGHALGLIDLYDTDKSSEGIGNWSLMASGSWGRGVRYGDRPSHMDPWSKRALGWVAPTRIMTGETGKTLQAVNGSGQVWQFGVGSPWSGGEYYLVENRQQNGFDSALPGAGMLLWHIDESRAGNNSEWYPGCANCSSHYKVSLLQADNGFNLEHHVNRGDNGDPFPGSAENRSVNRLTTPAALLYSGTPAGFALASVSDSSELMTVDIVLADGIAPVTTITAAPPLLSASAAAEFSFSTGETATFECRLDGGGFSSCTSPNSLTGLSDGSHSFTVRAIDLAGDVEATPPTHTWTVDTTAPETTLLATPPALTASPVGSFTFAGSEAGSTFVCALDGAAFESCATPFAFSGLAEGSHTFIVRASDPAGNIDPTPASYSWTIARNLLLRLPGQPDSYHATMAAALAAMPPETSALFLARSVELTENMTLNSCAEVTLLGGHAPDFTAIDGQTTIAGLVTVACGTLVFDGVSIR